MSKAHLHEKYSDRYLSEELKWVYTTVWTTNDPDSYIHPYQEDILSSKAYPITKACIVFAWIIRKKLFSMEQMTQLAPQNAYNFPRCCSEMESI